MINQIINELSERLQQVKSEAVDSSQVKALVAASLRKLDVVPREEFDVQAAVLQRTREKLDALEKQLAEMEAQFLNSQAGK